MQTKEKKIMILYIIIIVISIIIMNMLFNKKTSYAMNNNITQIEPQITSETTTSSTTTTTTTKTTKKTTKTTRKTTKVQKVATASRQEYINYAKEVSGYVDTQMSCLITLWDYESNWNPNDVNPKSGACGIPQSKPCNKIVKQQGSNDWKAQIRWGINYINYKYGSPCNALSVWRKKGWY